MKERSEFEKPIGLTGDAKSSKLDIRKMSDMAEDNKDNQSFPGAIPAAPGAESAHENPILSEAGRPDKPSLGTAPRNPERAKMMWEEEAQRRGKPLTPEEETYIKAGISPMAGGSDEVPAGTPSGGESREDRLNKLINQRKREQEDELLQYQADFIVSEEDIIKADKPGISNEDARRQAGEIYLKQEGELRADIRSRNPGISDRDVEDIVREQKRISRIHVKAAGEAAGELSKDHAKAKLQKSEQERQEQEQREKAVTKTAWDIYPEPSAQTDPDWHDPNLSDEENKRRQDDKKQKVTTERNAFIERYTREVQETRLSRDNLREIIKNVEGLSERLDRDGLKKELIKLRRFTHTARRVIEEKRYRVYDNTSSEEDKKGILQKIDDLFKKGSDQDIRDAAAWMRKLGNELKEHYDKAQEVGLTEDYARCFEDLAQMIMDQESDEWRTDGKYQLIEKKQEPVLDENNNPVLDETGSPETHEIEIFHPENFLRWIRSRIYYLHDVVHTNDKADMLNEIEIPLTYRSIRLAEIINTPRYYQKKQKVGVGKVIKGTDETGKTIIAEPILGERKIDRRRGVERIETEDFTHVENQEYKNLKDQLFWEAWMFQNFHNHDADYRLIMGDEGELPKTIFNTHYFNTLTQNRNRLLRVLRLPGVTVENGQAKDNVLDSILKKGDDFDDVGEVGMAIRRSILAYYYLPDEMMFKKVMGERGMEEFYKSLLDGMYGEDLRKQKKAGWIKEPGAIETEVDKRVKEDVKDVFGNTGGEYRDEFLKIMALKIGINFGEDGKPISVDKDKYDNFATEFNEAWSDPVKRELFALKAFKYHYPTESEINTAKVRFVAGISGHHDDGRTDWEKLKMNSPIGGLHGEDFQNLNVYSQVKNPDSLYKAVRTGVKAGVAAAQGFDKDQIQANMDYVDGWAFSSTYFTGISANNDTAAIGFDKDVIRQSTKENQTRAISGRGAHAYEEHVSGANKLGLNLWQYLKVNEEGRAGFDKSLLEVLQGGQGNIVNLSEKIKNFSFQGNAQRQMVIEHMSNGYKLVAFLEGMGLDFDGWFKIDKNGDLVINYDTANKLFRDGLWHDARYCFDQPEMLWNHKIRYWRRVQRLDRNGKPIPGKRDLVFMEGTIAEAMFDDEIRNMGMFERGDEEYDQRNESTRRQPRDGAKVARDFVAWAIAKELRRRRKWGTGQRRFGWHEIETIKGYFTRSCPWRTIEVEIPLIKDGKEVPLRDKDGNLVYDKDGNQQFVMIKETRVVSHFFNDHEWEDSIADVGHARMSRIKVEELSYDTAGGLTRGVELSAQAFLKAIIQGVE